MKSKYVNDFLLKVEDFSLSKATVAELVNKAEEEMVERAVNAFIKHCNICRNCPYIECPKIIICETCGITQDFINLLNS